MYTVKNAAHASNLGCVLALELAQPLKIPAFICDPVSVDEMVDEARITGLPEIRRTMLGHALNCRAMARRCAEEVLHKPLEDCRLIVLHLGGGASARLFIGGKMVDGVRDDEWMFAPERFGGASLQPLVHLCYSGKYTEKDMMDFIRGKGGLVAYFGVQDARAVEQLIADGNELARDIYWYMGYQIAKGIGELSVCRSGKLDCIILTGGMAYSKMLTDWVAERVSFLAPVKVIPGEHEMQALARGGLRVLRGEETPNTYTWYPPEYDSYEDFRRKVTGA